MQRSTNSYLTNVKSFKLSLLYIWLPFDHILGLKRQHQCKTDYCAKPGKHSRAAILIMNILVIQRLIELMPLLSLHIYFCLFCLWWKNKSSSYLSRSLFLSPLLPFLPTLLEPSRFYAALALNIPCCGISYSSCLSPMTIRFSLCSRRAPFFLLTTYKRNIYFSKANCLLCLNFVVLLSKNEDGQIERLPLLATIAF